MKMLMDFVLDWSVHVYFCRRHVVAVGNVQMLRAVVGLRLVPRSLMSLTTELFQMVYELLPVFFLLSG